MGWSPGFHPGDGGFDTRWQHQSLGHTPRGEAADCKSVGETHAWFDSKMTHQIFAHVAQLVEHGIEDPGVGGSIPSLRTKLWRDNEKRNFCS